MASQSEIDECFEVALDLAKRAGAIAREAYYRDKRVEAKSCSADLVTETDKKVEGFIFSHLRQKFPTHKFIGEESVAESGRCDDLTDDPTWMVDPIDGTTNFVHKFPFTAVSIGLTVSKESVVGVVYNFVLDEMFAAKKGAGATMNGKPIHAAQCTVLNQAMVVTEMGYDRSTKTMRSKLEAVFNLAVQPAQVHGIRTVGSAALNMCLVACGSVDAYYEYGIHCWDICAGDIIVREAGGVTLFPTGEPLDLMRRGILCASTEQLAMQLLPHLKHLEYTTDQMD